MILDRITIAGADDSVRPEDLAAVSKAYPFVEWAILASQSRWDTPRYASLKWMDHMDEVAATEQLRGNKMQFALHICGRWVRSIQMGHIDPVVLKIAKGCDRVQLNFGGESSGWEAMKMAHGLLLFGARQIIFQIDGNLGQTMLDSMDDAPVKLNAVPLYDRSHGKGETPDEWPAPVRKWSHQGYAGGLGPDNLATEIPRIAQAAGDCRMWLDMESKIRSHDGLVFDLDKVRACLEIARPFVESSMSDGRKRPATPIGAH